MRKKFLGGLRTIPAASNRAQSRANSAGAEFNGWFTAAHWRKQQMTSRGPNGQNPLLADHCHFAATGFGNGAAPVLPKPEWLAVKGTRRHRHQASPPQDRHRFVRSAPITGQPQMGGKS